MGEQRREGVPECSERHWLEKRTTERRGTRETAGRKESWAVGALQGLIAGDLQILC